MNLENWEKKEIQCIEGGEVGAWENEEVGVCEICLFQRSRRGVEYYLGVDIVYVLS